MNRQLQHFGGIMNLQGEGRGGVYIGPHYAYARSISTCLYFILKKFKVIFQCFEKVAEWFSCQIFHFDMAKKNTKFVFRGNRLF